eukprot:10573963-Lingulodinium_polyedra.AAC.1
MAALGVVGRSVREGRALQISRRARGPRPLTQARRPESQLCAAARHPLGRRCAFRASLAMAPPS